MDTLRNSVFGQIVNHASGHKLFQHPEEQPDFVLPSKYSVGSSADIVAEKSAKEEDGDREITRDTSSSISTLSFDAASQLEHGIEKEKDETSSNSRYIVVDWYGPNDQENPQNWSTMKKSWIMVSVALLTTSIYMGSSIFTPAAPEMMAELNTTRVKSILPLTTFVLGYGIGPMFLSPLSEYAPLGRTYIYITTLLLFVLIQIPTALANTIEEIIGLRLLAGIFASPALSTGGATIGDAFSPSKLYIGLVLWGVSAFAGPTIGPLVGGIFAQLVNWRWIFWFMTIIAGFALLVLFMLLPETNAATLLHRRAQRLRKLTGNDMIKSPFEVSKELNPLSVKEIAIDTLWRPIFIAFFEPMVFFLNLYCAFIYIIVNTWFEAFPIVFIELYGFNQIEMGLTFLTAIVGAAIGAAIQLYMMSRIMKAEQSFEIEKFLIPAMVGSFFLPVGLFIFAWGASVHAHWMAPVIGASFFCIGAIMIFQSIFSYLGRGFYRYLASVFAGNCLMRSWMAAVFPVFANPMFKNLGSTEFPVGAGGSILAAISVAMIAIPFVFHRYGVSLRGRSQYAN